jgi:Do/DeqQ family serine protease
VAGLAAAPPASAALPLAEQGGIPTLAPLLERVTPAVVNIAVVSQAPAADNPLLQDPFFRRFFNVPESPAQAPPRISAGSGVIVDAGRGYVVTNHHVVENAAEIAVTLKDRRQVEAKLVGSDPDTDIAVLKIDPKGLTEVPFGDAGSVRVGDFVVAIGNPFGLGQTVTSGIVSALGRSGLRPSGYEDFIQTDASINPGNSGGALINLKGELVGINTAIVAPAGGNVGIGFAVPSNMARAVMEQLIRGGEVRRGRLGVAIQDVTPDIAAGLGREQATGAIVESVEPGSPAARAGIQPRDIIVALDGETIEDASALRNKVGLTPAGRTVELRLIRDRREMSVRVGVEERKKGR